MFKRFYKALIESDNKVVAFIGRGLQRYKQFLKGVVVGVLITILVIEAREYILMNWFSGEFNWEDFLEAPPFPREVEVTYDWSIHTLDDREFDMNEMQGKVVFLNFWATWCPPCVGEMPSIQRLYDSLKDEDGVVFACVSDEKRDIVKKFVDEKGFTFPIYTIEGERPEDFKGRGIPATFILSKEGKIAFKHIGSAKWDDQTSIDFIKKLL